MRTAYKNCQLEQGSHGVLVTFPAGNSRPYRDMATAKREVSRWDRLKRYYVISRMTDSFLK